VVTISGEAIALGAVGDVVSSVGSGFTWSGFSAIFFMSSSSWDYPEVTLARIVSLALYTSNLMSFCTLFMSFCTLLMSYFTPVTTCLTLDTSYLTPVISWLTPFISYPRLPSTFLRSVVTC
jgi:hypothetical protein